MVDSYTTLNHAVIPVHELRRARPTELAWLLREALGAPSWGALQARTARGARSYAELASPHRPEDDALLRLQLDLVGQTGIATDGLSGDCTTSYAALLFEAFLAAERSSGAGLFAALHAADRADVPVVEEQLHATVLAFLKQGLAPAYNFVARDAERHDVYSERLDSECLALKERDYVVANSPIRAGAAGRAFGEVIVQRYPPLLKALQAAAARITPAPEVVEGNYQAYDIVAGL